VLIWGIRESARFNAVMVGIKIVVLTFFIAVGAYWVKPENWTPFAPNGWAGISAGAAIVFFAYIGFDAVSTAAEETRNPKRDLPIGIIASLIICTIFYVIVSLIFTGLISYPELKAKLATEQAEPLTMALEHASPTLGWAVGIVAFGSVIAHTAVLFIFQLGQPRIFFSMARDGLLPKAFTRVHPRFRTPWVSTIITGAFVAIFAAVASIDEMVDLTNIGTLFAFILVSAGIMVLRRRDPDRPRPFRVPSGLTWAVILFVIFLLILYVLPWTMSVKTVVALMVAGLFFLVRKDIFPVLGIVSCLYLIYYLPPTSWLRFAAWLNLGFVIYAGYGLLHSRLSQGGEETHHSRLSHSVHIGAWLALIGTFLLYFMRGLDIVLTAGKEAAQATVGERIAIGVERLVAASSWTELSWFLLIPLLMNAFVLCPILISRILHLRAQRPRLDMRRPFIISVGLMLWSAVYAVMVMVK
jgi:APA family basic amino acid/polyamine antiporter